MKCAKCNFISFDYNPACPKCGNDLAHERDLMNLPAYKPTPPSLLGALTGDNDIPADATILGETEVLDEHDRAAEDLLISLDILSGDEAEPIRFEPEPAVPEPEQETEALRDEALDELSISLDDLSGDEAEPIRFEPEPAVPEPEQEIEHEMILESEKEPLWDPKALEERMAAMEHDAAEEPPLIMEEEIADEAKGKEPLLTLELEPLEIDMEEEKPRKKTS